MPLLSNCEVSVRRGFCCSTSLPIRIHFLAIFRGHISCSLERRLLFAICESSFLVERRGGPLHKMNVISDSKTFHGCNMSFRIVNTSPFLQPKRGFTGLLRWSSMMLEVLCPILQGKWDYPPRSLTVRP